MSRPLWLTLAVLAGCGSSSTAGSPSSPTAAGAQSVEIPLAQPPAPGAPSAAPMAVTQRACTEATCAFDRRSGACAVHADQAAPGADGPRCTCSADGASCELSGWNGKVRCTTAAECGCTRQYRAAPAREWPLPKPGDCIVRCTNGECFAAQGMM
jgi:hypothetical protein